MKFAYADPPYLGCGRLYKKHHPEAMVWDSLETHKALILRLQDEFPDGWAMSASSPSLRSILPLCPDDVRVMSWVKPFCIFKPNVGLAYSWEPVIFRGGRRITREQKTVKDHIAQVIMLKKGLCGAKPPKFCDWLLDAFNVQPGDEIVDLFPGTGIFRERAKVRLEAVV